MSAIWIIVAVLAGAGLLLLVALGWLWLARSWQVLDDDELHQRLSGAPDAPRPALWFRMRGWFRRRPPQLTYRRDGRGRFRRIRRW